MDILKIKDLRCTSTGMIIGQVKGKSQVNAFRVGNGCLFSINVKDDSGVVRMVFFNDLAKKHSDSLEIGKWYSFSSFRAVNRQNAYEIHCTNETTIQNVETDDVVEYLLIDKIINMDLNDDINVIGLCQSFKDDTFSKKDGSGDIKKKTIAIIDMSGKLMNIDIFGEHFERVKLIEVGSVVAFHNMRLKSYNNEKYLLFTASSFCQLNDDKDYVAKLKEVSTQSIASDVLTYDSFALNEVINMFDKTPIVFNCVVKIIDIDLSHIYKCCPMESCQKKIQLCDDGRYECAKCGKFYTNYGVHALLKILFDDGSIKSWITSFHTSSIKLFQMASNQFGYLWEFGDGKLQKHATDEVIGKTVKATAKIMANKNGDQQITIIDMEVQADAKISVKEPKNDDEAEADEPKESEINAHPKIGSRNRKRGKDAADETQREKPVKHRRNI